jgi:hypothetical protein
MPRQALETRKLKGEPKTISVSGLRYTRYLSGRSG